MKPQNSAFRFFEIRQQLVPILLRRSTRPTNARPTNARRITRDCLLFLCLLMLSSQLIAQERKPDSSSDSGKFVPFARASTTTVLAKVLTKNDDASRHGVLIPTQAWNFFPAFENNARGNQSQTLDVRWFGREPSTCQWKHYSKYPERRLTALRNKTLSTAPPGSLLLVGKHPSRSSYQLRLITPQEKIYSAAIHWIGLTTATVQPGQFAIRQTVSDQSLPHSVALQKFLKEFDAIRKRGWIPSRRSGSTGVGYTLESMLQLEENNSPRGDYLGMELKAWRHDEWKSDNARRMNLFLKEPQWIKKESSAQRIHTFGYRDDNGRQALYSTVQARQNSHGFLLRIDQPGQRVFLTHEQTDIGFWTFETLGSRLQEKHSEAAFVSARSRHRENREEFLFDHVVYCAQPSISAFIDLIQQGKVVVELRMHVKTTGGARNHGTAFRIQHQCLPQLYSTTIQCR